MATENEVNNEVIAELIARTALWNKLSRLVDVILPLVEEAVKQGMKVQKERR